MAKCVCKSLSMCVVCALNLTPFPFALGIKLTDMFRFIERNVLTLFLGSKVQGQMVKKEKLFPDNFRTLSRIQPKNWQQRPIVMTEKLIKFGEWSNENPIFGIFLFWFSEMIPSQFKLGLCHTWLYQIACCNGWSIMDQTHTETWLT